MPLYFFEYGEDCRHVEAKDMAAAIHLWQQCHETSEDPDKVIVLGTRPVIREFVPESAVEGD